MQSKKMSLLEVSCSTLVGFIVALLTQLIVFPLYGIEPHLSQDLQIALIFTVVSIIRSYIFRRVFNALHRKQ